MIKCTCVDVEIGSYDNQVTLRIPPHMEQYSKNRVAAGLSPYVCIDRCILPTVEALWGLGIKTSGCCCGHGKTHSYIGVLDEDDAEKMKDLGYTNDLTSGNPDMNFLV